MNDLPFSTHLKICLYTITFVCVFSLVFNPIIHAQNVPQKGDVTADGIIDGRDALLVLRSTAGLETLTVDEKERGDVYPNPGLDTRTMGDGRLTVEDARQILRFAVHLIPETDLNGNRSVLPPVIHRFDPHNGGTGTNVWIEGENFIGTVLDLNIVSIGGIPVKVLEVTGTSMRIEIPAEAESGVFEVNTPGGSTASQRSFTVTTPVHGNVDLGQGIDQQQYTVVSPFEETRDINPQGDFDISVKQDGLSLIGAVPSNGNSGAFFSFVIPELDINQSGAGKVQTRQLPTSTEISALTTAKALIFLHPFFATNNPIAARWLMEAMDSVPEVQDLAAVIADRYPGGAKGLSDSLVQESWTKAVRALLDTLPDSLVFRSNAAAQNQAKRQSRQTIPLASLFQGPWSSLPPSNSLHGHPPVSPLAETGKTTVIRRSDMDFVELEYIPGQRAVQIQYRVKNNYNPLDWLVTFYPVDPTDMPEGLKNPFLTARRGIQRIEHWKNDVLDFLPSNQWTANISPSNAVDVIFDSVGGTVANLVGVEDPLEHVIDIDTTSTGVYACRAYSGALGDNDPRDHLIIPTIDNGPNYAYSAMLMNLTVAFVDLLGDFLGDDTSDLVLESVPDAILELNQRGLRLYPLPPQFEQKMAILMTVVQVVAEKAIEQSNEMPSASDALKEQLKEVLSTFTFVRVLDQVSTVGKVGERIAALMGYLINPLGLELSPAGPTPLESCFVQVGDPFNPSINRIEPTEGPIGTEVTIFGKNFQLGVHNNIVKIGNINAKIVEVVDSSQLKVQAPVLLARHREYNVTLQTDASSQIAQAPQRFFVSAEATITRLVPNWGYSSPGDSSNPFFGQTGTLVKLEGVNLHEVDDEAPYLVYIGGRLAETRGRYDREIDFFVREKQQGNVNVYVLNPNTGERSNEVVFYIFEPPEISGLSTTKAKRGQFFEIEGDNLLDAKVQIGDSFANVIHSSINKLLVEMPNAAAEGESVSVTVWTPSGSASTEIVQDAGLEVPVYPQLQPGVTMTVENLTNTIEKDGKLSLPEAVLFASGKEDPFSDKWDDSNETFEEIYQLEKRTKFDANQNPIEYFEEVKIGQNGPILTPGGPGLETITYWKIVQNEQGDEISRTVTNVESKDATDDDKEEGDLFPFAPSQETQDKIVLRKDANTVRAGDLALAPGDQIDLDRGSTLILKGDLFVAQGGTVNVGEVQSTGTIHLGNNAKISSATLSGGKIILEDAIGAQVFVQGSMIDSPANAVEIQKGGKNYIQIERIDNGGGDGIYVENSPENTITVIDGIHHVSGNGVTLTDSPRTTISSLPVDGAQDGIHSVNSDFITINGISSDKPIQNCKGDGIYMEGADSCKMEALVIRHNGGHGIHIAGGKSNTLTITSLLDNTKSGLWIDQGAGFNKIDRVNTYRNGDHGILIDGNTFNSLTQVNTGGNGSLSGNGNGLVLSNGASFNTIDGTFLFANQGSGILLSGANTENNVLSNIEFSLNMFESERNPSLTTIGDGIRIENGAHNNRIHHSHIAGFNNGVVIDGGVRNEIENCFIGDIVFEDQDSSAFNRGRGIIVSNQSSGTLIHSCTFGYNSAGGIYLDHLLSPDASKDNPSVVVRDCKIGTAKERADIRKFTDTYKSGGPAIECQNVKYVELENILTYLHEKGILSGGSQNDTISLKNVKVLYPAGNGLSFDNTTHLTVGPFAVFRSGQEGVALFKVEHAEFISEILPLNLFWNTFSEGSDGYGLSMESCKDILVRNAYISDNLQDGIHLVNSDDITFVDTHVTKSGQNGCTLQGCSQVNLERLIVENSQETGLLINASNHVDLVGERPLTGFGISGEQEGMRIQDSQDITIGKDGRGGGVSTPLTITGSANRNIRIQACFMASDKEKANCMIDGGQDIVIGSNVAGWGNVIESGRGAGVLVQGDMTGVSILGNIIGLREPYQNDPGARGNEYGIVLEQGANNILVQGNKILFNRQHGIWLHEGANRNSITRNLIVQNGGHGVLVEGASTRLNQLSQNSIYDNAGAGIRLSGGNDNVQAPVLTRVEYQQRQVAGTVPGSAPDGTQIEVYADDKDEGETLIGITQLYQDKFVAEGFIPKGKQFHALAIYPGGNTSEFGPALRDTILTGPFLFSDLMAGKTGLYLYNDIKKHSVPLSNGTSNDDDPRLSPDGTTVLFVSDRNGTPDLWTLDLNTMVSTSLTDDPAPEYDPAWLPDGQAYVYVSEKNGNPDIYLGHVNQDTGSSQGAGELSYFEGEDNPNANADDRTDVKGNGVGVQFDDAPGALSQFDIFIASDPAPIQWKIIPFVGFMPNQDEIVAQGEADITDVGWNTVDVGNIPVPEKFLLMIYFTEDLKPKLGLAAVGEENHAWTHVYFPNFDRWNLSKTFARYYMIKARFGAGGGESGPVRLTDDSATDRNPAVSPDGSTIAFTSNRAGQDDVWLMDIDGSNLVNLTRGQGNNRLPDWSPDGLTIAFVSDRDGNPEIYSMDATGQKIVRLTNHDATDVDPEWLPNGNRILFSSNRPGEAEIYSLSSVNPVARRVTIGAKNAHHPESGKLDAQEIETRLLHSSMTIKSHDATVRHSVMALGDAQLSLSDAEADPGDTVALTLQVQDLPELGNLDVAIEYNPFTIHLVEEPAVQLQANHFMYELNPVNFPAQRSPLQLNWIGAEGLATGESNIRFTFQVQKNTVQPQTTVRISKAHAYDIHLNPIELTTHDGTIVILGNETEVTGWMLY